jgi:hypothetical protein
MGIKLPSKITSHSPNILARWRTGGISKLVEKMEDRRMKENEGKKSSKTNSSRVPKLGKKKETSCKAHLGKHERIA